MFKNRINGFLLGAALVAGLTACSHPKDPFVKRIERPAEICNGTVRQANPQDAFGDSQVLRYVVKRGDTLWSISKRFLVQPWHWKAIWYNNPQIRNPHLIYPGDVLSIVQINGERRVTVSEANSPYRGQDTGRYTKDGRKIVKYKPGVRTYAINDGPISIADQTVAPFVLKTQVLSDEQIAALPGLFGNNGEYLTLTTEKEVFAKTELLPPGVEEFDVYRPGEAIGEYDGNKLVRKIGTQMDYIGKVSVLGNEKGVTKFHIENAVKTIQEGDLIIPTQAENASDYFPQLPSGLCSQGYMIANLNKETLSVKEFDTVITSLGADNSARVGDVWKIVRKGPSRIINGQSVQIPDREIGYLMIIRVYNEFSIGFVLDSTQNIDITDALVEP